MPVSSSTSHANTVNAYRTAAKTRCQGILDLYEGFAKSHVQLYKKRGKVEMISRAKIELQILDEIEKAELPIEYKLSWYYAVSLYPTYLYHRPYAFFC